MAKKRRGDLEKMRPPNDRVQFSDGRLADVKTEDGKSAFVKDEDCIGDDKRFARTLIDPFRLEELLDTDAVVKRIGKRADEQGGWNARELTNMERAVLRVMHEEYLGELLEEMERVVPVVAEYMVLRTADKLDLERIRAAIRAIKLKR